ncbi:MAG: stress protein [Burkholderiales bacterium PBB3]|nr:MAG: stress protein [Burkholderiales bacterium PBB3]
MNIVNQNSPELAHVAHLIKDIPVAMLTHVQADGTLASRPMSPIEMDAQGAIWFFVDVHAEQAEHLRVLNLSFSDSGQGTYVSLSGTGEIDIGVGRARIQHLWTPLARPWFPDGPDSESLALLKFVPESADYWDAPNSRMARAFGVIASVISGTPIAIG